MKKAMPLEMSLLSIVVMLISGCAGNDLSGAGLKKMMNDVDAKIRTIGSQAYKPIDPSKNTFEGLFKTDADTHEKAIRGENGAPMWPRAAITYVKYGSNLKCWTIKATIWKSAKATPYDEVFNICHNVPMPVKDDLGNTQAVNDLWLTQFAFKMTQMDSPSMPNTGMKKTAGPNPPSHPWKQTVESLPELQNVNARIMLASGIVQVGDYRTMSYGTFNDYRMWFYKFEPDGNTDDKMIFTQ